MAIEGEGVLAVVLDQARLKGCNLASMSVVYVKCFDIMPLDVDLWLARELGMDKSTLRALVAMYRQLRRAFSWAGSLGECWPAKNEILQEGPLSLILINLRTSILKLEIDDMPKLVVVATQQLPPRIVRAPCRVCRWLWSRRARR